MLIVSALDVNHYDVVCVESGIAQSPCELMYPSDEELHGNNVQELNQDPSPNVDVGETSQATVNSASASSFDAVHTVSGIGGEASDRLSGGIIEHGPLASSDVSSRIVWVPYYTVWVPSQVTQPYLPHENSIMPVSSSNVVSMSIINNI